MGSVNRRTVLALSLLMLSACAKSRHERAAPSASVRTAPAPAATLSARPAAKTEKPPDRRPRLLALGIEVTKTYREKRFEWRLLQGLNWQANAAELPPLPPAPPLDEKGCPAGMVLVDGEYLLDHRGRDDSDQVLLEQNATCTHFRTSDHGENALCDSFDRQKWLERSAKLPRQHMRFCIDRYEFPNSYGELPLVVVTYSEARAYCKKANERLCNETEWTFACEGEEGVPYPYGYERDSSACVIDILAAGPDKDTFRPRNSAHTAAGIDFAWHGKRSGESPRCKSPFGVYDMTGNVDEWTQNTRKYGYEMILKGGHWGPARQRCRPATRGHGPYYLRYDEGFRCCADAPPP
jgi:sulfatase modifying factor 1